MALLEPCMGKFLYNSDKCKFMQNFVEFSIFRLRARLFLGFNPGEDCIGPQGRLDSFSSKMEAIFVDKKAPGPYILSYTGLYGPQDHKYGSRRPHIRSPIVKWSPRRTIYSGDLISKHLKSGNTWISNFYLYVIQIVRFSDTWYHGTGHMNSRPVFKYHAQLVCS